MWNSSTKHVHPWLKHWFLQAHMWFDYRTHVLPEFVMRGHRRCHYQPWIYFVLRWHWKFGWNFTACYVRYGRQRPGESPFQLGHVGRVLYAQLCGCGWGARCGLTLRGRGWLAAVSVVVVEGCRVACGC